MRGNAGIIGPFQWPNGGSADTAKGVFSIQDVYNKRIDGNWPLSPGPTPAGTDTETAFVGSIPERLIATTYSSDYSGKWDVGELQTSFSGSGRLYLAAKITGSPTYRNDLCVACVQILSPDKTTLEESWHFDITADQSAWATYTYQVGSSSTAGVAVSPATAAGYTYVSLSTITNVNRWSLASYTASTYTGMYDGISSYYDSNIMSLGTNSMYVSSYSSYYAYREASGSTRYSSAIMRGPSRTWAGGEWIRMCYAITGLSTASIDYTDSIFVATY